MQSEINIRYKINEIRFGVCEAENMSCAFVDGKLKSPNGKQHFRATIVPENDGKWTLKRLSIGKETAPLHLNQDLAQGLVNASERLLRTINTWPGEQTSGGAKMNMNEIIAPEEVRDQVFISFRSNMLGVPCNNWLELWPMIEGRHQADPYFKVQGFNSDEIQRSIRHLKTVFPAGWVKARYRKAGFSMSKLVMGAELPLESESWFPAYHLARTALGAICIDPGWNYLLEIGLSIEELQDFEGTQKLTKQLAKSPGTQHHFCLAAELFRRGLLIGLEPPTGTGSASNDLLVRINDREYEIEVKEFSSANPIRRLQKELDEKIKKMPPKPNRPLIFHVVLADKIPYDKETEDGFFKALTDSQIKLSPVISAVVGGRRFVDANGGRIKRDSPFKMINPDAILKSHLDDLDALFKANYKNLKYPLSGIGNNGFSFGAA